MCSMLGTRQLPKQSFQVTCVLRYAVHTGGASEMKTEPARAFDRARAYYSMLMLPADEVLKVAGEKPLRYSAGEWMALLQVSWRG